MSGMKPPTVEYATPSRRARLPTWVFSAGPLILFVFGAGFYGGAWAIRAAGWGRYEAMLTLRIALEGVSPLTLAAGCLWGGLAIVRTRRMVAVLGMLLNTVSFIVVFYRVFLSVKK